VLQRYESLVRKLSGSDALAIRHPIYQDFSSIEHEPNFQRLDCELHIVDLCLPRKTGREVSCNLRKTGKSGDINGEERKSARECRSKQRRRCGDKELRRYVQKSYSEVGVPRDDNSTGFELHEVRSIMEGFDL